MLERLFSQLTLVGGMQVEKLAAGIGHAADRGHTQFEAGLVAGKVVTDQLAMLVAKEGACMLASTDGA